MISESWFLARTSPPLARGRASAQENRFSGNIKVCRKISLSYW